MERDNNIHHTRQELDQLARELVNDFRQLDTCTPEEITSSWQTVVAKTNTSKSLRYWWGSVAACLLIGLLTFLYYTRSSVSEETVQTLLTQQVFPEMYSPGDVYLFRAGERTSFSGNTTVDLRSPDKIIINGNTYPILPAVQNQLIVPKGKRGTLLLADGSRIDVNAGSRVIFPTLFTGAKREIALEGEACLEVNKDAQHPFIVHTTDFKVQVLGTLFNVITSRDLQKGNVILAQGAVELQTTKENIKLLPGEQVLIDSDSLVKKKIEVYPHLCWKEGILFLENRKVKEIAKQLSDYYGYPVLCDPAIQNTELGGKLSLQTDLSTTVDILCEVAGFKSEIQNNALYLKSKE